MDEETLKNLLKKAFEAGKDNSETFEKWYQIIIQERFGNMC